ncbi:hypothetical protein BDW75DRAFT_237533 [Aspergillus navahoensis]
MPDLSPADLQMLPPTLEGSASITMLNMDNIDAHRWASRFVRALHEAGINTYSLALGKVRNPDGTAPYMLWLQLGRPDGPEGDSKDWLKTLRSRLLGDHLEIAPEDQQKRFAPCSNQKTKNLLSQMEQRTHATMYKGIVYIATKRGVFNEAEHERYRALYDELMTDEWRLEDLDRICNGLYGWPEWRSLPLYQALFMELEDKFEEDYLQQLEREEIERSGLSALQLIAWYRDTYRYLVRNHIEGSERRERLLEELEKKQGNWTEAVAALAIEDIAPAGLGDETEMPEADAMGL